MELNGHTFNSIKIYSIIIYVQIYFKLYANLILRNSNPFKSSNLILEAKYAESGEVFKKRFLNLVLE